METRDVSPFTHTTALRRSQQMGKLHRHVMLCQPHIACGQQRSTADSEFYVCTRELLPLIVSMIKDNFFRWDPTPSNQRCDERSWENLSQFIRSIVQWEVGAYTSSQGIQPVTRSHDRQDQEMDHPLGILVLNIP